MKILLFDIDGTLIDAGNASKRAFDAAFQKLFGVMPNADGVITHGSTDPAIRRDIFRNTFDRDIQNEEYRALSESYLELLPREIIVEKNYRIMPGVENLLRFLQTRNDVVIGFQTGNVELAIKPKLERSSLLSYFSFGGFGTDSDLRHEIIISAIARAHSVLNGQAVSLEDVIVIGDTPQDVQAGKVVGAQTIAVCTGIYSKETLQKENPTQVFDNLVNWERFFSVIGL